MREADDVVLGTDRRDWQDLGDGAGLAARSRIGSQATPTGAVGRVGLRRQPPTMEHKTASQQDRGDLAQAPAHAGTFRRSKELGHAITDVQKVLVVATNIGIHMSNCVNSNATLQNSDMFLAMPKFTHNRFPGAR